MAYGDPVDLTHVCRLPARSTDDPIEYAWVMPDDLTDLPTGRMVRVLVGELPRLMMVVHHWPQPPRPTRVVLKPYGWGPDASG